MADPALTDLNQAHDRGREHAIRLRLAQGQRVSHAAATFLLYQLDAEREAQKAWPAPTCRHCFGPVPATPMPCPVVGPEPCVTEPRIVSEAKAIADDPAGAPLPFRRASVSTDRRAPDPTSQGHELARIEAKIRGLATEQLHPETVRRLADEFVHALAGQQGPNAQRVSDVRYLPIPCQLCGRHRLEYWPAEHRLECEKCGATNEIQADAGDALHASAKTAADQREQLREYLDNAITEWRAIRGDGSHKHHALALYYIDAFQSVRASMIGETLA